MDLDLINTRIDAALASNNRAERVIVRMAVGIFVLGAAVLVFAFWLSNPYVAGGTVLLQGFLYWPIREIRQLRRENISLQSVPALVASLPPETASDEIVKLLAFIRKGRAK